MQLLPLHIQHAKPLLEFELSNRDWFESHIAPRATDFYHLTGVQTHIAELLLNQTLGKALPYLIVNQHQTIVGRVNLHNIHDGKAFLGYRVGEKYIGRGVAKSAVSQMINIAEQHPITQLIAIASVQNLASQSVLTSQGFTAKSQLTNFTQVQGTMLDCIEYQLSFV